MSARHFQCRQLKHAVKQTLACLEGQDQDIANGLRFEPDPARLLASKSEIVNAVRMLNTLASWTNAANDLPAKPADRSAASSWTVSIGN